jgi:uncharacterized protein (TIGR01777 family)
VRVGITGSSGFLGTALTRHLTGHGHDVVRFVRRPAAEPDERSWDGESLVPDALAGLDAHVHLSGAGVGDKRWSPAYKAEIRRSRVQTTRAVAKAVAEAGTPVLLNANAIGYYGDRGGDPLDESAAPGTGFLADVCVDWRAATAAVPSTTRLVVLRTGIVLGEVDGELDPLLARLVPLTRFLLGAPVGSGKQYVSWIALEDWLRAVTHLLGGDTSGPVNVTSPAPATNAELVKALGRALHRPTMPIGVPGPLVRLVAGGLADEALGSAYVVPTVLEREGFVFTHPTLETALAAALDQR